jgi:hypothetical protein
MDQFPCHSAIGEEGVTYSIISQSAYAAQKGGPRTDAPWPVSSSTVRCAHTGCAFEYLLPSESSKLIKKQAIV